MRNIPPAISTLDSVLSRSLAAVERTRIEDDVLLNLHAVLIRISRLFRATVDVVSQTIIEPAAVAIEVDGQYLNYPRLLVQCTSRSTLSPSPLTFFYVPSLATRITLRVGFGNTACETPDAIEWVAELGDWFISGLGELGRDSHATFVRNALTHSRLFAADTMTLEPKAKP